ISGFEMQESSNFKIFPFPSPFANIPKEPRPAAITDILKLYQQPIRIGEIQFRRSARGAASVFHSQTHIRLQRAHRSLGVFSGSNSVRSESLQHIIRIE